MTNHQQFKLAMQWVDEEKAAHELTKKALASATADIERFKAQVALLEQELTALRREKKGGWA
jgi:predicted  nucleic acid-binding Zn-ribbon protein